MVLKRQSVMTTNERQKVTERRRRDEGKRDTMLYLTAQGAKHAGKCLESMVSADPKVFIHLRKTDKAPIWMDPLSPGQLYIHLRERLKSLVVIMKMTKNKDKAS